MFPRLFLSETQRPSAATAQFARLPQKQESAIVKKASTTTVRRGSQFVAIWLLLFSSAFAADSNEPQMAEKPTACELILKGRQIESLVLKDENGVGRGFSSRTPSISLPPGNYSIQSIELKGGYSVPSYRLDPLTDRLVLEPGRPCRPKFGAPLTPSVTAKRTGRLLELSYQLLDGDGHVYSSNDRSEPPRFAIYKGDALVGSGAFEYG